LKIDVVINSYKLNEIDDNKLINYYMENKLNINFIDNLLGETILLNNTYDKAYKYNNDYDFFIYKN
jgi:hypothetical protein